MSIPRTLVAFVALVSLGCRPPYMADPGVSKDGSLYQGSTGPLSYQASSLADGTLVIGKTVHAEACQQSIVLPIPLGGMTTPRTSSPGVVTLGVGWGDGGYARAMAEAEKSAGGGLLVDVRADRHFTTVLWVYRRDCVEVHAAVASPRR